MVSNVVLDSGRSAPHSPPRAPATIEGGLPGQTEMDALDRIAIGHRVATLRHSRHLSVETAAHLAGGSRRWLYDVEAGRAALPIEAINGLAAAFAVSPAVIECIEPIPDLKAEEVRRRDFLRGAVGVFGAIATTQLGLSEVNPASVTGDHVASIEALTRSLREVDNQFGGGYSLAMARAHLQDSVLPMIRSRSYDTNVGADLLRAGSHLAHLAGWMSFDLSQPDDGAKLLAQARELALAAGDQEFVAEITAGLSHQMLQLGDYDAALLHAQGAQVMAAPTTNGVLLAECHIMEARAAARLDERKACAHHLNAAETWFARGPRDQLPDWLTYFDEAYLAAATAHCLRDLGDRHDDLSQRREAQKHAERSLNMNPIYVRGRMFNTALLATTFVGTDQDEAIRLGRAAVDLAAGLQSRHSRQYIADLQQRLEARASEPAVRAFDDYVVDVLGS